MEILLLEKVLYWTEAIYHGHRLGYAQTDTRERLQQFYGSSGEYLQPRTAAATVIGLVLSLYYTGTYVALSRHHSIKTKRTGTE